MVGTIALALAALATPAAAEAHSGGKAVPVSTLVVRETGPLQALIDLRMRDEDGGEPVRGATVRGFGRMTSPHTMFSYFGPLPEVAPGRYRARVKLPMTARWTLELTISGEGVVTRKVETEVVIDRSALTEARSRVRSVARSAPAPVVAGKVRFVVTGREVADIAVLWTHGIAATAWIVGLVLLLLASTAGAGAFAPAARSRLAGWYRGRGLPLLWASAAAVVVTGIYNTLRVTPFDLAWSPGGFRRLSDVPYGRLYESLLLVKIALFVLMLVAGIAVVRRARRLWGEDVDEAADARAVRLAFRRLGAAGVIFVASAPVIVVTAVALRYVHILTHVAEAAGG